VEAETMVIGLLGLQGAFRDHIPHLTRLGAQYTIVTNRQQLGHIDRLVIPGGESTVMGKFLRAYGMRSAIRSRVAAGMPVWGICAGAILLAQYVDGAPGVLDLLPIAVTRNAYGRQNNSRKAGIDIPLLGVAAYPAIFIRSPRIDCTGAGTAVFARDASDPVFIQKNRIMATTFHPELNSDDLFHRHFLSL
jgi:5'-phosphate synthase pdxT subunit